jgi:hypothetical protein
LCDLAHERANIGRTVEAPVTFPKAEATKIQEKGTLPFSSLRTGGCQASCRLNHAAFLVVSSKCILMTESRLGFGHQKALGRNDLE